MVSIDSPWDEHPESTNTIQEQEWTKISSEFTTAGYREGITAGKESTLQEGFDKGFATTGVPIGRELGIMRGIVSAFLAFLNDPSASAHHHQILVETQEINAGLSRIRFSDIMPPDLEAEEHARLHREEMTTSERLDFGPQGSTTRELEVLEDMMEQMNTDSAGQIEGRPTAEDVKVLRNRLDRLAARMNLDINDA